MSRSNPTLEQLTKRLAGLVAALRRADEETARLRHPVSSEYQPSARNLIHYLELRRHDLRPTQAHLAALGLSSLGRAEGCTYHTLQSVLGLTYLLQGIAPPERVAAISCGEGRALLKQHTNALLGPSPSQRYVRIMVTVPGDAAGDPRLIFDLLNAGMDCMRVNCAHDDPAAWKKMVENLRQAERAQGRTCRVLMDLSGPKLRTGPMMPGPSVIKYKPIRDEFGRVQKPARIWLTPEGGVPSLPAGAGAAVPVPRPWLESLQSNDVVVFRDARGAKRQLRVEAPTQDGCWATLEKTAYLTPGTLMRVKKACRKDRPALQDAIRVGRLPERPQRIRLRPGDRLIVTSSAELGRPAIRDAGSGMQPARIGCTLPEVFRDVRIGETIWFDDGKIGGVIREAGAEALTVEITQAAPEGEWLGSDKGINLPDTDIRLPSLTQKDLADLEFVTRHADLVGYSFVRHADDVHQLHEWLRQYQAEEMGIVLKIETRRAFENLPEILLAAMQANCLGAMIARGDLAVECGFERLAEVQEEMLWVCEAAHVPVIWATQVLENAAKLGRPSRAEITDAAMGERAECVMLNKGPRILEAVALLDRILQRMEGHQHKKSAMLRQLHLAQNFALRTPDGGPKIEKPSAAPPVA